MAAFTCGLTRVATATVSDDIDPFIDWTGYPGWHELAHAADKTKIPNDYKADADQNFFESVVLDLARKLDAIEETPGSTYLDNTLICWTQEASWDAHVQSEKLCFTIGNVNNYFKTGNYLDVRNIREQSIVSGYKNDRPELEPRGPHFGYAGLLMNQWWANILYALGIPKSEWEGYSKAGSGSGYGPHRLVDTTLGGIKAVPEAYHPQVIANAGAKLPIIT